MSAVGTGVMGRLWGACGPLAEGWSCENTVGTFPSVTTLPLWSTRMKSCNLQGLLLGWIAAGRVPAHTPGATGGRGARCSCKIRFYQLAESLAQRDCVRQ